MQWTITPEQSDFQQSIRAFLQANLSEADVRRLMHTDRGYDRPTWRRIAVDLGLGGLTVSQDFDGAGAGMVDLTLAFEELGAVLAGLPALSTLGLALPIVARNADIAAAREVLAAIVGGATATLALREPGQSLAATRNGDDVLLSGQGNLVLDGHTADWLLVAAEGANGPTIFAVRRGNQVRSELLATLDQTRKLAHVFFDGAPAIAVGQPGAADRDLEHARQVAVLCSSAEQLGGSSRCLSMMVDYTRTRYQFGRAIGSYQAVKHRCADALLAVESTRSAVRSAAWIADHDPARLGTAVALAASVAGETFVDTANVNIQNHGGVGFTWEHPAHLYLKRAKAMRSLYGGLDEHADVLADALGV